MSPTTLIRLLATGTFFCSIIVAPVHSICCDPCGSDAVVAYRCPYCKHEGFCNGVGKCNIFCCACDTGCWKDVNEQCLIKSTYATMNDPKVRFAEFDTDTDGFITLEEVFSRGAKTWDNNEEAREQFAAIDDNGDGRISWSEFQKHA